MKGSCGDEENMISPHRPVFCIDGRTFDNRQQISLDTFS